MTLQDLQKEYFPSLAPEDFFVLVAEATGRDRAFLLAHPEYALDVETETNVREWFARRLKREPVASIVGHKEFYGRDFLVTPATLIPRPETECIIDLVLAALESGIKNQESRKENVLFADIGTGSGNIIVTLAAELKSHSQFTIQDSQFSFHATDISPDALTVARDNAARHDVSNLISFHHGDLLSPIIDELGTADHIIITANLPYLSEEIYGAADDDVKVFEPRGALVSDEAGLSHSYRLLEQLRSSHLPKHLQVFFEISPEQSALLTDRITGLFPDASVTISPDLSGRDRIVGFSLSLG